MKRLGGQEQAPSRIGRAFICNQNPINTHADSARPWELIDAQGAGQEADFAVTAHRREHHAGGRRR